MFTNLVFLSTILAVAFAQGPQTCFTTGTGPATDCGGFIGNFCQDVAKDPLAPHDSSARCYNAPGGKRCDFIAFNRQGPFSPPSPGSCQAALNNLAKGCPRGGSFAPDAFTFTLDPNLGPCTQNVPGSN